MPLLVSVFAERERTVANFLRHVSDCRMGYKAWKTSVNVTHAASRVVENTPSVAWVDLRAKPG